MRWVVHKETNQAQVSAFAGHCRVSPVQLAIAKFLFFPPVVRGAWTGVINDVKRILGLP